MSSLSEKSGQTSFTTTLSTKGQVILPKAVRDQFGWRAGTRLTVEEHPDGVLLREEPLFPVTRLEDVVGSLKYDGPAKSIEEMDAGVAEYFRTRARD